MENFLLDADEEKLDEMTKDAVCANDEREEELGEEIDRRLGCFRSHPLGKFFLPKEVVAVKIKFPYRSDFSVEINGSLTVSLTSSPLERLLKRLYENLSKRLYFTFAYAPAAIGTGFPQAQLLPLPSVI